MSSFLSSSENPFTPKKRKGKTSEMGAQPTQGNAPFMTSSTDTSAFDELLDRQKKLNTFNFSGTAMNPQVQGPAATPQSTTEPGPVPAASPQMQNVGFQNPTFNNPNIGSNPQVAASLIPEATEGPRGALPPKFGGAQAAVGMTAAATPDAGQVASEVQSLDDAPSLITMLHQIQQSDKYPPDVRRAMTDLVKTRLAKVQADEKHSADLARRSRQADARKEADKDLQYSKWVDWMKSNPNFDVTEDLSREAFDRSMKDSEQARTFRAAQRLKAMQFGATTPGMGFGAGQNAAEVLNRMQAGEDVNNFLGMLSDPNLGLPGEASTEAMEKMARPMPSLGPNNYGLDTLEWNLEKAGKGMSSTDVGEQQAAVEAIKRIKSMNDAVRATPQWKKYEADYIRLQNLMSSMGLSADAQMRIQSGIQKGIMTPATAINDLMARRAGQPRP